MNIKADTALFSIMLSENVEQKINEDLTFKCLTRNQKAKLGEIVWAELQVLQNNIFTSLDKKQC